MRPSAFVHLQPAELPPTDRTMPGADLLRRSIPFLARGFGLSTPAVLALEDGTVFHGTSVGADGKTIGEVVFNTAMTGYQEILTDPSYCRTARSRFTFPHIGNVGTNERGYGIGLHLPCIAGWCIRAPITDPANYRATHHLHRWLEQQGFDRTISGRATRLRLRISIPASLTRISGAQRRSHRAFVLTGPDFDRLSGMVKAMARTPASFRGFPDHRLRDVRHCRGNAYQWCFGMKPLGRTPPWL